MKNKTINIIFIILIIIMGIECCQVSMANDVFFDLVVGRSIINNGFYNIENTTIHEGLKYNSIHWLYEMCTCFIHSFSGFFCLYIFTLCSTILFGLLMYKLLKKTGITKFISFLITFFSLFFMKPFFSCRAQVYTYICMFITTYSLEMLYKTNKDRYIIYSIISFLIIANIQSYTYVISLSIFVPFFLEKLFSLKKEDNFEGIRIIYKNKNIKKLIITFIGCCVIGLVNPYGITIYYEPFIVVRGYAKNFIGELSFFNIFNSPVIIVLVGLYFTIFFFPRTKIICRDAIMTCMYLIASVFVLKFIPYLIVCNSIAIGRLLDRLIKDLDENTYNILYENKLAKEFLIIIISMSWAIYLYNINTNLLDFKLIPESVYPIGAVDWIKENLDYENMRLFNCLNYGSYIEYSGIKVFIDSRNEMYENNTGDSIEKDVYLLLMNKVSYKELYEKYNIDYAIVAKYEDYYIYINNDEDFDKVYDDEYFSVFVKNKEKEILK